MSLGERNRATGEGLKLTHLQQGEEILVFVFEFVPLLNQRRHQLLDVFLEREQEVGDPWVRVVAWEPTRLPLTQEVLIV